MTHDLRPFLPQVTLCAVSSVNVAATLRALEVSLEKMSFAKCLLLTDATVQSSHGQIEVVRIAPLRSSAAYSDFLLSNLVDHVTTSHCLIAQWDGHVLHADRWEPKFLDYDYIGASWPQFDDGHDVGNGGFSLRSRQLMILCRAAGFVAVHPEDVAIGRTNRAWLEGQGMRFAPSEVADRFAAERAGDPATSFGYHGVFGMPRAVGVDSFWKIYRELDDLSTIKQDFARLLWTVGRERGGLMRAMRMVSDRWRQSRHI